MPVNRCETACRWSFCGIDLRIEQCTATRFDQNECQGIVGNAVSGVLVAGNTVVTDNRNGLFGIQMSATMYAVYRDNTVLRFVVPFDDVSVVNGGGNVSV